jgi:hypothetical protein
MDKEYFNNYSGMGEKFEDSWTDYTISPIKLMRIFDKLKFYVNSVFDIGAADGSWLRMLTDRHPDMDVGGIEIYKPIINHPQVEHADIVEYSFNRKWDVVLFNGLAYISPKEVSALLKKLHSICKYFVVSFECWDSIRFGYPSNELPEKIYEKTLRPYTWWLKFFNYHKYDIVYYDAVALFLSPVKTRSKLNIEADRKFIKKIKYDPSGVTINRSIRIDWVKGHLKIHNAKKEDLIQIGYFLNSLTYRSARAEGKHLYFVPGWINLMNGTLSYYVGLY